MMRKGISPIISSVLVLAVSVSIASLYSGWAPGFTKNLTESFNEDSRSEIKCQNAGLDVRNADYDRSDHDLVFDLENTGTIRFPNEIDLAAMNNSLIMEQKTVESIEVGETLTVTMEIEQEPEEILASPSDCADLTVREPFINTTT